jgi:hypothetical protein
MPILSKVYFTTNISCNSFLVYEGNWKYEPIIQWDDLVKHISWGAIFLLGAGLSIALAFKVCLF